MAMARRVISMVVLTVTFALPVLAGAKGTVVGPNKKPVHGATVCYMLSEDAHGICAETDEKGFFELPASHMTQLRIQASGLQTRFVKAVEQTGMIEMKLAAAVWVRVRDSRTGRTVENSEVYLIFPDGRREGPLPANDKGLKIRTLMPGRYGIVAKSDGFTQTEAVFVDLVGGDDKWIDVTMKPAKQKS